MGFLAPLYLALAAAAAVPLLLHLMRRRSGTRVEFPAARYLQRAEQEHSRHLRLRNLLLMLLRVAAVLLIALAAARPVGRMAGAGHPPTALAVVLDNSLSTGQVVGGRPVLDELKRVAGELLDRASASDRLWLVALLNREAVVAPLQQTARTAILWAFAMVGAMTAILVSSAVQLIRGRNRLERLRTEMIDKEMRDAR